MNTELEIDLDGNVTNVTPEHPAIVKLREAAKEAVLEANYPLAVAIRKVIGQFCPRCGLKHEPALDQEKQA